MASPFSPNGVRGPEGDLVSMPGNACTACIQLLLNVKVYLRPPHAATAEGLRADDPGMRTTQCLQYLSLTFTGDHNSVALQGVPLYTDLMLSLLIGVKLATQAL